MLVSDIVFARPFKWLPRAFDVLSAARLRGLDDSNIMSTLDGRQPTFPHLREDVGICEHIDYAFEHGIDKLEIRDWKWPSKPA